MPRNVRRIRAGSSCWPGPRTTWVALTSDPRRLDQRQHPLKGALGVVKVGGAALEQWQFEVTGGGRIWSAIDDDTRTLWITRAGTGHPKQTDTRRR